MVNLPIQVLQDTYIVVEVTQEHMIFPVIDTMINIVMEKAKQDIQEEN